MKGQTRAFARRVSLEKKIGAISLRIAKQQILAIPYVNALAVQVKANDRIKALAAQAAPLQAELKKLEYEAGAETRRLREQQAATQKGRRR